ncbi:MAG: DUF1015 domain-containing protein [Clostridiales bacterium]|nr:DUF1015 domain-containing protein [Clostridiales bacterium]
MTQASDRAALKQALAALAVGLPDILLPAPGVDLTTFAVVACDQHSANPAYWAQVEALVGDAPSALRLMLPECHLGAKGRARRLRDIHGAMRRYLDEGVLRSIGEGMVYLHRQTSTGLRRGLVLALDLEQYDYAAGSKSLIRATEGTILDRLPPRVEIRAAAPIELPHILVLVDDPEDLLMGPLERALNALPKLYDFPLMLDSGRLAGWQVKDDAQLSEVAGALETLCRRGEGLLFAMGDGNHSLATAKACWEQIKPTLPEARQVDHPARYALCEVVNLHDPALAFESIHRVLFGVTEAQLAAEGIDPERLPGLQVLQPMLDDFLARHPEADIDYIHGEREARALGEGERCVALILPPYDKGELFPLVRAGGLLVRKSFSMGHAQDKRFYLEARRLEG